MDSLQLFTRETKAISTARRSLLVIESIPGIRYSEIVEVQLGTGETRIGQVIEDSVEENHVERLESEPRQIAQLADLEPDVCARAGAVGSEEASLPDPVVADVESDALSSSQLFCQEEKSATVASTIQNTSPGEALRIDHLHGSLERHRGVIEPHLAK